jgi:5-methylcytosine-specific restriction endonuclease McrA
MSLGGRKGGTALCVLERKEGQMGDMEICKICGYIFERKNPRQIYSSPKCKRIRDVGCITDAYYADIPKARARRADYYLQNKERELAKAKEWRAAHPGRMGELGRKWNKKNPNKRAACNSAAGARRSGAIDNADFMLFQAIREEFSSCVWCGKEGTEVIDHIIPIRKGGINVKGNLVVACRSCNSSKSNKDWLEWYKTRSFYSEQTERFIRDRLSSLGG